MPRVVDRTLLPIDHKAYPACHDHPRKHRLDPARFRDLPPKNLTGDLTTQDMRGIVSSIHDAKHSVKLEVKGDRERRLFNLKLKLDVRQVPKLAYSNGPQTSARFTPAVKVSMPPINFSLPMSTSVI